MYELFSYWVLLWAFLFYIQIIKYNPIFILFFIYLISSLTYVYIYINNGKFYYLLKFIILNILLKFIFTILIANYYPIIFNINDIYFGIILIIIYLILMISLNKNPLNYYYYLIDMFINGINEKNSKYYLFMDKFYDDIYKKI